MEGKKQNTLLSVHSETHPESTTLDAVLLFPRSRAVQPPAGIPRSSSDFSSFLASPKATTDGLFNVFAFASPSPKATANGLFNVFAFSLASLTATGKRSFQCFHFFPASPKTTNNNLCKRFVFPLLVR
ncbi:hypothetical protein QYF48_22330 [Brevibacillus agri]|uniref:hypothetical protein n=1 Tax=Brevibacillus agri TaxID=51101 RepID=UPI0025B6FAB8|nr:hypothetical protein [Brevibacillus agri]MDN4095528.1 hypothetical protein [Brevibacillus agri]